MKRIIIGILLLVLVTLSLIGCGDSIVNNPIEVVDSVEVGMTRARVEEVVDMDYFKDNRAFRVFMVAGLVVDGDDFTFSYTKDDAPHYGYLFFSVEFKTLKPALVIFKCKLADAFSDDDVVVAVGAISFEYGQMIVEEETGKPFRR
ncbi:unnamed protein product [marine sediment metagenome]|uniref:Uncharacterized protein n=1 Tax=marine sediment metagenome TaxID=412755 RepID=X1P8I0_9ZZZZ